MFGAKGRIGLLVPANNGVLEPELWSRLPSEVALYATRLLARGDLTPKAVRSMEQQVDRAVEELVATIVDLIIYADMVTTFIMEEGWNEAKIAEISEKAGVPCISAWSSLREALGALSVRRFALGTPYPATVHALVPPFFERNRFSLTDHATLDIAAMQDVPRVTPERLGKLVGELAFDNADAVVLLATDLPTYASIETLERRANLPVVTSNQAILWNALRTLGITDRIGGLGKLFDV